MNRAMSLQAQRSNLPPADLRSLRRPRAERRCASALLRNGPVACTPQRSLSVSSEAWTNLLSSSQALEILSFPLGAPPPDPRGFALWANSMNEESRSRPTPRRHLPTGWKTGPDPANHVCARYLLSLMLMLLAQSGKSRGFRGRAPEIDKSVAVGRSSPWDQHASTAWDESSRFERGTQGQRSVESPCHSAHTGVLRAKP